MCVFPPSCALQGFGNVGSWASQILHEQGGRVVAVADAFGGVANERGLDIPELRAQADYVDATQASDIHNFLLSAWDQFREEVAPEVLPADTEDSVAQTERMLLSQARNSVLGRL